MDDTNALHFAAQKGHSEVCRTLLDAGLSVNSKTRKGMNALHFAATGGHADVVTLLLRRKADPVSANKKGQTALQLAKNVATKEAIQKAMDEAAASTTSPKGDSTQQKERQHARKRSAQSDEPDKGGDAGKAEAGPQQAGPEDIGPQLPPKKAKVALTHLGDDDDEADQA
ncbi:hypothetical protein WJX72_011449 [[Myrmecia] bisecta]|uniref:Ankyrin repeat protein n=1 Tax=[Myrmecia] bisecta TaxID=41462 RepID=A0AAW1P2Y7_9CHLO